VVPLHRSFAFRFVGLYTVVVVAILVGACGWLYTVQRAEVEGKFGLALESIAGTAAPFIAGEDVLAVQSNDDVPKPPFQRVRAALERIRAENNLGEDAVYILRARPAAPSQFEFVVMLQARTFVGDVYRPPPMIEALYRWVVERKDAVRTSLYRDQHGQYISGVAPILAADGRVVAMLQVDYGVDKYLDAVGRQLRVLVGGAGLLVALFLGVGAFMQRRLRRSVAQILQGTDAITQEHYDYLVAVRGQDELSTVADALNQALRKLKERFEMLKFLPRHTARMIAQAAGAGGVQLSLGKRVRVAVLNSDIRGFTKISEAEPPEQVVAMLNDYIRVQAEIVNAAGGSIDKFMGDAVLAIFEDPDMERRAVECALAIQEAVTRLNATRPARRPVRVGVGVAVGEVVMGNMGSHDRMEYTVIGSTVNLASRLCGVAGPGEVIVSDELTRALGEAPGLSIGPAEQVQLKGFEAPVFCHRLASASAGPAAAAAPVTAKA
jgi:class 3 adenylate cyclase